MGDLDKQMEMSIKDPELRALYRLSRDALTEMAREELSKWQSDPGEKMNALMGFEDGSFDPELIFGSLGERMVKSMLDADMDLVDELVLGMKLDFSTDLEALSSAMEDLNEVFVFIIDNLQLDL